MAPAKPLASFTSLAMGLLCTALPAAAAPSPDADSLRQMLGATNNFWTQQFKQLGGHYQPPTLTTFSTRIDGACGQKNPLSGSFYCPADQHLYVDSKSLEALGARAEAYSSATVQFVIAHLVAHHVQFLIGTTALVQQARSTSTPDNANRTLVTMELQADCYAGLWLHSASQRGLLSLSSQALPAVLAAVAADSKLRARGLPPGVVVPDSMDTGTMAQRVHWTQRGFDSGNFEDCDTFGAAGRGEL
jgi:predicted metalloprotease